MTTTIARRSLLAGTVGALAVGGPTACGDDGSADATPGDTRTVSTVHGDVEVPAALQRIVAVSYDTAFQLLAVGVTPAGAQDYSAYYDDLAATDVEALRRIPSIGPFGEPDLEAIAALRPDVIVGDSYEVDDTVHDRLSAIAPTVVVASDTRGDWATTSSAVADAVGAADALLGVRTAFEDTVARLRQTYAQQLADNRFGLFSIGNTATGFSIQLPSGASGALLAQVGATPTAEASTVVDEAGYASYSLERLDVLADATVFVHPLDGDGSFPEHLEPVTGTGTFAALPAARSGHVTGLVLLHSVTHHAGATAALEEFEAKVLTRL